MDARIIAVIATEIVCTIVSLIMVCILALQKDRPNVDHDIQTILLLCTVLMLFDSLAYTTYLSISKISFELIQVSNAVAFIADYLILAVITKYLYDYLNTFDRLDRKLFQFIWILSFIAIIGIIVNQYTGFIYYFNEENHYVRGKYWILCQVPTIIGIITYIILVKRNASKMRKNELYASIVYIILPLISTVFQIVSYGIPYQNIAIVISSWVLFFTRELEIRNELEEANNAKLDFLRRMSHDIRTPLNGILGIIEVDDANSNDIELLNENRKKARTAANHLLALLNDILDLSKLTDRNVQLSNEAFDMKTLMDDVITISELKAEGVGIVIDYQFDSNEEKEHYVYGSPLHIRQIFLNIIDNCIKYNKLNGKVTVLVSSKKNNEHEVSYKYSIQDTGIGMSESFIKHIFEPFSQERTDEKSISKGTGLGMSIVKTLIDKMNGTLLISSKVGVGSDFEITLPFELADKSLIEDKVEIQESVIIEGKHILLVDDNDLNREIAKTLLEDKGLVITEATGGQEAIDIFKNSPEYTFDMILMDVMMPTVNGLEATSIIRRLNKKDSKTIPIIALTANAFAEDVRKTKEAGMNEHLTKPIHVEDITQAIMKYCK